MKSRFGLGAGGGWGGEAGVDELHKYSRAVKHFKGTVHKFKSSWLQFMPVRFKWKPVDV